MVDVKARYTAVLEIEAVFVATRHLPACPLFAADAPSPPLLWLGLAWCCVAGVAIPTAGCVGFLAGSKVTVFLVWLGLRVGTGFDPWRIWGPVEEPLLCPI